HCNRVGYNYVYGRPEAASSGNRLSNAMDALAANLSIYRSLAAGQHIQFRKDVLESIVNSYKMLTRESNYQYFLSWNQQVKDSGILNTIRHEDHPQLFLLRKSSFLFYLIYYLPRALLNVVRKR